MKTVTRAELVEYFRSNFKNDPSWTPEDENNVLDVLLDETELGTLCKAGYEFSLRGLFGMIFLSGAEFENRRFVAAMKRDRELLNPPPPNNNIPGPGQETKQ